jgi:site-specific recombinase XerD
MRSPNLTGFIQSFFEDWLGAHRNLSPQTIASYRDCWRLFIRALVAGRRREVSKLELVDINARAVLAFLDELEAQRHVSIGTRNCRLAAIKSFARFMLDKEPAFADQFAAVLRVPLKRAPRPTMSYLEKDEVAAILEQPDQSKAVGRRDYALLAFLFYSGARIQEALQLTPESFRFDWPRHVKLIGKGNKERSCPLSEEICELILGLIREHRIPENERIFRNRVGAPLTATGFRFKLDGYVKQTERKVRSLVGKRVTPHTFRHSLGVQMVEARIDVTTIRNWLGHVSLDTTNHYARANLRTKREALEQFDPFHLPSSAARWKKDGDLLAWLDSL